MPEHKATIEPIPTEKLGQKAKRPLKGGLMPAKLQDEYPMFAARTVGDFLAAAAKKGNALTGLYAQYDKAGKHWYAPNKFEAYGEEEIEAVTEALRDGFLAPGRARRSLSGRSPRSSRSSRASWSTRARRPT